MFAAEMDPLVAFDEGSDVRPGQAIELPPVVVIAPNEWYSVKLVDHELTPMFTREEKRR